MHTVPQSGRVWTGRACHLTQAHVPSRLSRRSRDVPRYSILCSLRSQFTLDLEFIVLLLCKSLVVYGCYKALCSRCSLLFHLRL